MAAALVGVLAGSLLTSRAERTHWSREKQVKVCAAIVAESTRIPWQTAVGEESWRESGDRMEDAWLSFINSARLHVDPRHTRLTQVPVSRPPSRGAAPDAGRQPHGHPAPDTSSA